jgi:TetR/AcrR family transcriptional regulator
MARPRAADFDAQRDLILAQAVQAFADSGYASATMAHIALRCGVSKAGLYHYYTQKESLLYDALEQYTDRLVSLCQARSSVEPGEARLRLLIADFIDEYQSSRAHHIVLLNDVKNLSPAQRAAIEERQRLVVQCFADTIASAFPEHAGPSRLKPTTMALLGMINFSFAWYRPEGALSPEAFAHLVIGLWLNALKGSPPPL